MTHRKRVHPTTCRPCRNNDQGVCRFSDDNCWYLHKENTGRTTACVCGTQCDIANNTEGCTDNNKHNKNEHLDFREVRTNLEPPIVM